MPAALAQPLGVMGLSAPVAFQYPLPAARLGREPLGYLRPRGVKKYHSLRPNSAFSEGTEQRGQKRHSFGFDSPNIRTNE